MEKKEYKNFVITKHLPLEELKVTLIELTHKKTHAKVMHIATDDTENVFCLSFRTLPKNSDGSAHILEHTVLCGSEKYPVKDPFFAMTRRSLNTFMNAFTGSDFTCYPASSQNKTDFYNLLEVYLDAAFRPELKKMSFLQEGHRLEFKKKDDPKSPLIYKGVVFNEMKGALSSPDNRLWEGLMEKLLPDLTYSYNSGGDPKVIPSLTYEELIEFHKYFYHPSHCLFYFYGNFPLEGHLDFIEEKILSKSDLKKEIPPINKQTRFSSIKKSDAPYPVAKEEKNSSIQAFGYLTSYISDQETTLALELLDCILMETDASPLRYALLQSNLCTQVTSYLDPEMSEIPWVIVCKGCKKEDKAKIFNLIQTVLTKIVEEKIPKELVDAALHQLEFSRKEIVGSSMPYGLVLFMRAGLAKQNGCDAENALQIHALFEKLLKKIKDKNYLPDLIKKYFLNNPHQVHLTLFPDEKLAEKEDIEEKEKLEKIKKSLSNEKTEKILKQTEELEKYQKEIENQSLECLPKILVKDIPHEIKDYPLEIETINNKKIFFHNCFTNHIAYVDLIFDLPNISKDKLSLLSLFSSLLSQVDMKDSSYQENLQFIQKYLGGVGAYVSTHIPYNNANLCNPTFNIRGKALYRNVDKLFSYLIKLSNEVIFTNKQRIKELILQINSYLEHSINQNAMRYASTLSQASLNYSSFINESFYGLDYYHFIKNLAKDLDNNIDTLIKDLEEMKNQLFFLDKSDLVITCDIEKYKEIKKEKFYGLLDIQGKSFAKWREKDFPLPSIPSQGRLISSPVAFTSLSYSTVGYDNEDSQYLLIASQLMQNIYLHKMIREQQGAYGGGANYNPSSSIFSFYAYRDPHITSSKDAFYEAIEKIASSKNFTQEELDEAKLGIIQGIDDPITPSSRGITAYNWHRSCKTKERRFNFREKVLLANKENISNAVKKHLLLQKEKGIFISFAAKDLFEIEKISFIKIFPL